MNMQLVEASTYEDAKYAMFLNENVLNEDLSFFKLTEDKLYPIYQESDEPHLCNDYYIINDEGNASCTVLKCVNRKLYK